MAYAFRRLITIPVVLVATFIIAFALVRAAGPAATDATRSACDLDGGFAPALLGSLLRWAQLDADPCTGYALDGTPVMSLVAQALVPTLRLAVGGLALAFLLGAAGGGALARGSAGARKPITIALSVVEVLPGFVVAPALLWLVGLTWALTPVTHPEGAGLIIPTLALALPFAAGHARAIRDVLVAPESLPLRHATLARGLSPVRARARALRVATLPVLGSLGATASAVFMGAIAVELVFSVRGLGTLFLHAAERSDVNVLLGAALAYAAIILLASALLDLTYAALDPRVRSGRG